MMCVSSVLAWFKGSLSQSGDKMAASGFQPTILSGRMLSVRVLTEFLGLHLINIIVHETSISYPAELYLLPSAFTKPSQREFSFHFSLFALFSFLFLLPLTLVKNQLGRVFPHMWRTTGSL